MIQANEDEPLPPQNSKSSRLLNLDPATLPPTYTKNTAREELLLDYAAEFETALLQQFPQRRPLFLSPNNEANVRKFAPSFLKPARLPVASFSSAKKIAEFVSSSVDYEQLVCSTEPPKSLVCPQTTLEW